MGNILIKFVMTLHKFKMLGKGITVPKLDNFVFKWGKNE